MKNLFFILILLAVISGCSSNNLNTYTTEKDFCIEKTCPKYYSLSGELKDGVRVINIEVYKLVCNPDIIVINHGEKIRLILNVLDVEHGFKVEELGINVKVQPGKENIIEFYAEKSGIYELKCYVPYADNQKKLNGWFVVK